MTLPLPTIGTIPTRAHQHDAGMDLTAAHDCTIPVGGRALIHTGTRMAIPTGHAGLVCSRSGLALKQGLIVLNAPGVVDAGYQDDIGVILANLGEQRAHITAGQRIAQLLITPLTPVTPVSVTSFPPTDRGAQGFGSTGH